jgi:uncharacterized protein YxeA
MKKILIILLAVFTLIAIVLSGCTQDDTTTNYTSSSDTTTESTQEVETKSESTTTTTTITTSNNTSTDDDESDKANLSSSYEGSVLNVSELFTERDLEQEADLDDATYIELSSGEDVKIVEKGVYVISGNVTNTTIEIDVDDKKVQLVLDGVTIINDDAPAINVVSADKVFITTTDSENYLEVSGSYSSDTLDAVIFSKEDLVLNGVGTLEIVSYQGNGITSKDDLKITGGTYTISAKLDGIEANDSIRIYDGNITINSNKDAMHSENDEDASLGYIYIYNGNITISAADDGIQGNAIVQIDGGTINIITSTEGIEATYVQINGGAIDIYATDDGINATRKSEYDVVMEVNGGDIEISMAGGDTDALDANGNLYITGGTLNISANSAFDYDNNGEMTGGNVTVNGQTVTVLTPSQQGGGAGGGRPGGGRGGRG